MPNHVTNKIIFQASELGRVLALIGDGTNFDFARLIPPPLYVYSGDLTSSAKHDDAKDFEANWYDWNTANWGTKWNAYSFTSGTEGEKAFVQFETAWSVPYPIIVAFANSLLIPFELRYFDEAPNFWGIEKWAVNNGAGTRTFKRYSEEEDRRSLCIELKGYDPELPEDESA